MSRSGKSASSGPGIPTTASAANPSGDDGGGNGGGTGAEGIIFAGSWGGHS